MVVLTSEFLGVVVPQSQSPGSFHAWLASWLMVHSLDSPKGHRKPQFRPGYPPTACQHLAPLTPRLVLACSTASPQVCFLWVLNRPFNQNKSLADRSFNQGGSPVHKQHQNKRPRPKRHSRVLTVRLRCSHHAHCSHCTTHFLLLPV